MFEKIKKWFEGRKKRRRIRRMERSFDEPLHRSGKSNVRNRRKRGMF